MIIGRKITVFLQSHKRAITLMFLFILFSTSVSSAATEPTITWSKPADITQGTALSSNQLSALASVNGSFVYTPSSGTVLSVGTHTLHVNFTPQDIANYTNVSKDVTINVTDKITPTITWNDPADIIYGTRLSSTQLNAVASVSGTFTYTPQAGTVLSIGTHTLRVDFTPTDNVKYISASKNVTINVNKATVNKATPIITWINPTDIPYGTALSSTQLNAYASVPGALTYIPPEGTILSGGSHTLHVDFTPTDTVNYNTTSKDVTIKVIEIEKKTPTIIWSKPADISYGTALSSIQLNAYASVPGTLTYTPPEGTILSGGSHTLRVYFTPYDTANYKTASKNVTINVVTSLVSSLVASFKASPTSGQPPLTVQFTDTSKGSPTSWYWSFGDGTTSNEKNPVHKYTAAGTYLVTLEVKSAIGANTPSTITSQINVYPFPVIAKFTTDKDSGLVPLTVEFTDDSDGDPALWHWDFGDGSTSNSQNPRHAYYEAGTYEVCEKVSNTLGTSISEKRSIIYVYPSSIAYFTTDISSGLAPLTVQFTDISSGIPVYWSWDFGDRNTSNFQNPRHTYYEAGTYIVTLEAQNAFGVNIPESSSIINVYSLPVADFSSDVSSGRPPLTVQFTDNSIGNPTAWFWDFGDGTTSNHENPIHTYIADGTYKVTLTVSNAVGTSTTGNGNYNGNGASISESSSLIYVSSTIIGPDFKSDVTTGTAPLSVQFHDNSNGNPTAWQWDFDSDGQVDSTAQNPVYEFKNSGNYNVALRVNNGNEWRNITKANYIIVGAGSSSASGGSSSGSSHTSGKASVMSASSSPEPPSNIEAKAFSQNYVLSKNHIKFEFTAGNIPVGVVEFDAKKTLGKITTTVEQLKRRSPLTPTEPEGKVIKYLNIWVGNSGTSSPENIENAKVGFRISKEEVTKKEESYIVLQRYADGNWNFLETTKTGEDSQYEYYQAMTSGFSSFAITKMNKSEYNNTMGNFAYSARITPIKEMNNSTESKLNNSSEIKVESENTFLSGGKIIIIAILLMIIFLVGLIVKEKRKK